MFIRLEGETRQPVEAVQRRIESYLESPPGDSPAWLAGTLRGDKFSLVRQTQLRSFLWKAPNLQPLVLGRLEPTSEGTKIRILLTLGWVSWGALAIGALAITGCTLKMLGRPVGVLKGVDPALVIFWPIVLFFFYWGITPTRWLLTHVLRVRLHRPETPRRTP